MASIEDTKQSNDKIRDREFSDFIKKLVEQVFSKKPSGNNFLTFSTGNYKVSLGLDSFYRDVEVSFKLPNVRAGEEYTHISKEVKKGSVQFANRLKELIKLFKTKQVGVKYTPSTIKRLVAYQRIMSKLGFKYSKDTDVWNYIMNAISLNKEEQVSQDELKDEIVEAVKIAFDITPRLTGSTLVIEDAIRKLMLTAQQGKDYSAVNISFKIKGEDYFHKGEKGLLEGKESVSFIRKLKTLIKELRKRNIQIRYTGVDDKRGEAYDRTMKKLGMTYDEDSYTWHEENGCKCNNCKQTNNLTTVNSGEITALNDSYDYAKAVVEILRKYTHIIQLLNAQQLVNKVESNLKNLQSFISQASRTKKLPASKGANLVNTLIHIVRLYKHLDQAIVKHRNLLKSKAQAIPVSISNIYDELKDKILPQAMSSTLDAINKMRSLFEKFKRKYPDKNIPQPTNKLKNPITNRKRSNNKTTLTLSSGNKVTTKKLLIDKSESKWEQAKQIANEQGFSNRVDYYNIVTAIYNSQN